MSSLEWMALGKAIANEFGKRWANVEVWSVDEDDAVHCERVYMDPDTAAHRIWISGSDCSSMPIALWRHAFARAVNARTVSVTTPLWVMDAARGRHIDESLTNSVTMSLGAFLDLVEGSGT